MFFGFVVVYALRVNFSVALVAMVNMSDPEPAPNSSVFHACPLPSEGENTSDPHIQIEGVSFITVFSIYMNAAQQNKIALLLCRTHT